MALSPSRLDTAFAAQTSGQTKLEIVDANFQPTKINVAMLDDTLTPWVPAIYRAKDGKNLMHDTFLHAQLQSGELSLEHLQPSTEPANSIHLTYNFSGALFALEREKRKTFQIEYVFRAAKDPNSIAKVDRNLTLTEEEVKAGKKQVIVEVADYNPNKHKPFTVNLTADPNYITIFHSTPYFIPQFPNLKNDKTKKDGHLHSTPELVDISKSADGFYLQIIDPSSTADKIQVKVKSRHPSGSHSDNTTVVLHRVPNSNGLYRSEALAATSVPEIDRYAAGGHKDNRAGDQTFLALPGSSLSFSYQGQTFTKEVPVKKILPIKFYVYRDNEGKPVINQKWIDQQVAQLQKDLAPLGILVRVEPTLYLDAPLFIDSRNRLDQDERYLLADQAALKDPDFKGLRFIPAGSSIVTLEIEAAGIAYNDGYNTSFLARIINPNHIISHEAVHHLARKAITPETYGKFYENNGHFIIENNIVANLMNANGDNADLPFRGGHSLAPYMAPLIQDQIDAILKHPSLEDPPQQTHVVQPTPTPAKAPGL